MGRWNQKTLTIIFRLNYGPKQICRASFPIHTRLWKTKTVTLHYKVVYDLVYDPVMSPLSYSSVVRQVPISTSKKFIWKKLQFNQRKTTQIVCPMMKLGLITFIFTTVTATEYSVECQTDRIVISFDQQYLQGWDKFFKIRFNSCVNFRPERETDGINWWFRPKGVVKV